ncbi:tail fiber protein, partial [Morganella sp. GD04133]|uniref:phage baseplate protein n=1 Tax=Morganella sp. GD04133 TaxID=2975435 RepID=UPI00244D791B
VSALKEAFRGEMPAVPKTVQTTGDSAVDVMSQKAVTEAIKGIKVPEIKDASTTEKGIVQLDDALSESKTKAPTSKAVSDALKNSASVNLLYPVGIVVFFAQNKNPNTLFPDTKWSYIGENKTIRLANSSGDNIRSSGGSDNVTLTTSHLPAHSHSFSGSTSSFDYGTKTTNTTGSHSHGIATGREFGANNMPVGDGKNTYRTSTESAGDHSHTVAIGAHTHTFSGTTGNVGSGSSVSVVNAYVMLMGWYRTS